MYQSFVFLEVRVLVASNKKAFCNCETGTHSENCAICTRSKGSIPFLKTNIAKQAYTLAHSLSCNLIQQALYEYPTGTPAMPPDYQLCGASLKIAENGWLDIEFHKRKKRIPIPEIRIEEDAGRLMHTNHKTFMDFTTAGMPSIRIRTGNNLELGEEAEMFLTELKNRMRYVGIITDVQETHTIRCNAYTALTVFPSEPQHYVKLRNLNSFNFARQAINEDLRRQEELLKQGHTLISESRLWNARQKRTEPYKLREFISHIPTEPMREPHYYTASDSFIDEVIRTAPENQTDRLLRYVKIFGLSVPTARIICQDAKLADFFEATVQSGINPKHAADSLVSDILILLKRTETALQNTPLRFEHFAQILHYFERGAITYASVRKFLQAIIIQRKDPVALLAQDEWKKISDRATLKKLVYAMLIHHEKESALLKTGAMKYLEILSGLIMKETNGRADQNLVKQLIKEELNINIIYVLSMDKTITGPPQQDTIETVGADTLPQLLDHDVAEKHLCFEHITSNGLLSEALEPADWAPLIHAICEKIASGTANGIVLTHGSNTLVYTAPLLYWLFAAAPVPIVLTVLNDSPSLEADDHNEARYNLNEAIRLAWRKSGGVYVSCNGKVLSPLNLKFMGSVSGGGFVNWNMQQPIFKGEGLLNEYEESDPFIFESILTEAARDMFLIKTYPGIRTEYLLEFLKKDITFFFLELYEKGTANMQESPYALKELLNRGKNQNCYFYCTSQQTESIDFSEYNTAWNIWKEGGIPMGMLTTETAIALYYAASLVCDTQEELNTIMEHAGILNERES
ncbi:MAG: asparaginase domain-containing protein [Treponema sp.]